LSSSFFLISCCSSQTTKREKKTTTTTSCCYFSCCCIETTSSLLFRKIFPWKAGVDSAFPADVVVDSADGYPSGKKVTKKRVSRCSFLVDVGHPDDDDGEEEVKRVFLDALTHYQESML